MTKAPMDPLDIYHQICATIERASGHEELLATLKRIINGLLRRESDAILRDRTASHVDIFFSHPEQKTRFDVLVDFAKEVVYAVMSSRVAISRTATPDEVAKVAWPLPVVSEDDEESLDIPIVETTTTAEVDAPTVVVCVPPPPPTCHEEFQDLFATALCWRVRQVLTFFHRLNPDLQRELPRPFILDPAFADRLDAIIRGRIAPAMSKRTRRIAVFAHARCWTGVDTAELWKVAIDGGHEEAILSTWATEWAEYRRSATTDILDADFGPIAPQIGGPEIDLFASLIQPGYDRRWLEDSWVRLRQLYEQEMDRRVYQDKAREGALRDALLIHMDGMPDRTGEFLVMLCYFTFRRLGLRFLENFTFCKGPNVAARRRRIPNLMHFLDHPDVPALKEMETSMHTADQGRARALEAQRDLERFSAMPSVVAWD